MKSLIYTLALLFAVSLLWGCAGAEKRDVPPAEALFNQAKNAVEHENFEEADELIMTMREEYPFSPLAIEAELLSADVLYLRENFAESAASYRAFEENHPAHARVPYAIYKRGLSYYGQLETEGRDQTPAKTMVELFTRLISAYPSSEYAADAGEKTKEGKELLAGHELYVARFYLRKEEYKAALGRVTNVLRDYHDSKAAGEASRMADEIRARMQETGITTE
ncbi:outer membrane protein assembly factor BamD [bacterium]|nr:MAG: outer membrane protein assembly factor BamD [bacterium]